jgi:maltose alpha-D-glucosyltransferase / alpha-amylase
VIEDLWYKNALIYCLDVGRYLDGNGDGIGDFSGLNRKLDYLANLGVTCIWLQPFYPSPLRDNGYDVSEYYGVHPRYGSLGDFVEFMNHAQQLGLRVIVDLVVSHTSIDHPWFQAACTDPNSEYRDWYVWSDKRPANHDEGMVFPDVEESTWTYEPRAKAYYFHRFYANQPDLNTSNPAVRREILRIMGFWLQLGVSGFRMDAVPFLIERKGAGVKPKKDYEWLHMMKDFLQWRCRDAILLAEANVPPAESERYFGPQGERLQMMLNFPVNQRLFYAMATSDLEPLREALKATRDRPLAAQWVNFLRSHDELDLGRLTERQREKVFAAFAPSKDMQIFGRGIRRRLAPMLSNDRRRLEFAYSLLMTLPGVPMLLYGDEIALGEDLSLPGREAARTPMQWDDSAHGGFTWAAKPAHPVIDDPIYGYPAHNVAEERRDPSSFFHWLQQACHRRRECHEIGWGQWEILPVAPKEVLVLCYRWRGRTVVFAHNFSAEPQVFRLSRAKLGGDRLTDQLDHNDVTADQRGQFELSLPAWGYRWWRLGRFDGDLENPR